MVFTPRLLNSSMYKVVFIGAFNNKPVVACPRFLVAQFKSLNANGLRGQRCEATNTFTTRRKPHLSCISISGNRQSPGGWARPGEGKKERKENQNDKLKTRREVPSLEANYMLWGFRGKITVWALRSS